MAIIWQPERTIVAPHAIIARASEMTYLSCEPCSAESLVMLSSISRAMLADPVARRVPQYVALAYWLRSASLQRLKDEFLANQHFGTMQIARGVALHLPPTNVDTIFVYSWALSVLAGNSNIVRLPESQSADAEWLVNTIAKVVNECGASARQLFCSYEYGGQTERDLSAHCDLRMIWGGDRKVASVGATPIRPDGLSIGFPDRKSLAIISSTAYAAADNAARNALATQFYNDLFWFDQMGCGSPRLLIWIGNSGQVSGDFYDRLGTIVSIRNYQVETGVVIGKIAFGNDLLADGIADQHITYSNAFSVARVTGPAMALERAHGGGFLCEWVVDHLDNVPPVISRTIQTITHFGLSRDEIEELARGISGRGGYRIVPVGEALQFDPVWDGVSLFDHMTRKIVMRHA